MTILTPFFCHICSISHIRGKEFRKYWTQGFDSEEENDSYKWWRERLLINGFNKAWKNIAASYLKVGNESMSAIRFWTTEKGDYLTCTKCFARRNHWRQISRLWPVLLLETWSLLRYREVRNGPRRWSNIRILGQRKPVKIGWWKIQRG